MNVQIYKEYLLAKINVISADAINNCDDLYILNLSPNNLQYFEEYIFNGCSNLIQILFQSNSCPINFNLNNLTYSSIFYSNVCTDYNEALYNPSLF
jgi:hypothetical protein